MKVTYLCTYPGRLQINKASFNNGLFVTTDVKLQKLIENSAYFKNGTVRKIPGLDEDEPVQIQMTPEAGQGHDQKEYFVKPNVTATQLNYMKVGQLKEIAGVLGIDTNQSGQKLKRAIRMNLNI